MECWKTDKVNMSDQIVPNKICGYNSTKEYLEIHYRLLLEDFLYPLKKDIKFLKMANLNTFNQVCFWVYKFIIFSRYLNLYEI
jgi:hypothetical protein